MEIEVEMERVRTNIKIILAILGESHTGVGRSAGIGINSLGRFLGGAGFTLQNLIKICDVLDVPPALVFIKSPMTSERIQHYRDMAATDEKTANSLIGA